MHSKCILAGHCLSFLFCAPVYCIDAFSYLNISRLFPWYTTLQSAQTSSPCLTEEYLHYVPQHREPLVPSLDICDWGSDLVWEVLTSWEKQVMREVVAVTCSLSAAHRVHWPLLQAGTGSALPCTLLLVLPYCHSLWVPHRTGKSENTPKENIFLKTDINF